MSPLSPRAWQRTIKKHSTFHERHGALVGTSFQPCGPANIASMVAQWKSPSDEVVSFPAACFFVEGGFSPSSALLIQILRKRHKKWPRMIFQKLARELFDPLVHIEA